MKNKLYILITLLFLLLAITACGKKATTLKEYLQDKGILGEHSLCRVDNSNGVKGSLQGNLYNRFFSSSGSINGSIDQGEHLSFYWVSKPNQLIYTTLPKKDIVFVIDESKDIPTVEFIFDDDWFNDSFVYKSQETTNPNLNDFVMSGRLKIARIKISSAAMEKEIYLPKTP